MFYLVATLAIFVLSPFVYEKFQSQIFFSKWFSILLHLILAWVIVFHIIPQSYALSGFHALWGLAIGFSFFNLIEWFWHRQEKNVSPMAVLGAVIGLFIHSLMDGFALGISRTDIGISYLSLAVFLHRLPVGVFLYHHVFERYGKKSAWQLIILLCLATIAGFLIPSYETDFMIAYGYWLGLFQAIFCGGLFHMIFEPWLNHLKH